MSGRRSPSLGGGGGGARGSRRCRGRGRIQNVDFTIIVSILFSLACSSPRLASAYYLPGTYPREFKRGEHVQVEVTSLTSDQTELPFDYYSLPFCRPPEGVRRSPGATNPGTLLSGLRQENSPYNLSVKIDEKARTACKDQPGAVAPGFAAPLDDKGAEALAARISQGYRVRMILDNLPITTFDLEETGGGGGSGDGGSGVSSSAGSVIPLGFVAEGFPLGFVAEGAEGGSNSVTAFVNNHVELKVLVHRVRARPAFLRGVKESAAGGGRGRAAEKGEEEEEEERKRDEALIDAVADLGVRKQQRRRRGSRSLSQRSGGRIYDETDVGEEEEDARFMVVGFEVSACSVRRDPSEPIAAVPCVSAAGAAAPGGRSKTMPPPQRVAVGESIAYTYDVSWEESAIRWASRWDAYLRAPAGSARIHWLSLANSLAVALVMGSAVAFITARTIRRDLSRYEQLLTFGRSGGLEAGAAASSSSPYDFKETGAAISLEDDAFSDSGWRNLAGDVWRTPADAAELAAKFGSGVQILLAGALALALAAAGFLSPASRGALLSALFGLSLATAAAGGFAAARLWTAATGSARGWPRVAWRAGALYPSACAAVLLPLDLLLWKVGSSGAIPLPALASLAAAWLAVAVPLSLAGGAAAAAARPAADHPTRTNQIPRLVPPPPRVGSSPFSLASRGFLLAASGLLPFCSLVFELHFLVSSRFHGQFYYLFGFLFAIAAVAVLLTAQVSVVATYAQLSAEDHRWWGASFDRGGAATAAYAGAYCLAFALVSLRPLLFGSPLSAVVYFAYTSLALLALRLALGAVGLAASYAFVTSIYSTVKSD